MAHKAGIQAIGIMLPAGSRRLPAAPGPTAAFTLIEMLVALALVGTIATIVYGSYSAACRSVQACDHRQACSERTCLVLRLLARQIRCAYAPPTTTPSTTPTPQDHTLLTQPAVFRADPSAAGGTILNFITTGGPSHGLGTPTTPARTTYRYDSSSGTLSISCEPYLYRADRPQEFHTWRPALTGVRKVDLQFYDGRQWQSLWTGDKSGTLPRAVKIALTVLDDDGRSREFRTAVPILCRSGASRRISINGGQEP